MPPSFVINCDDILIDDDCNAKALREIVMRMEVLWCLLYDAVCRLDSKCVLCGSPRPIRLRPLPKLVIVPRHARRPRRPRPSFLFFFYVLLH